METHIGVGIGQYIEKEFANAKESLWIACPTLTISMTKKILSIAKKGIKVRIITSPRITPESEESNVLIRKFSLSENNKKSSQIQIEHKVVSNKEVPMIHVKLYLIDGKIAIFGSPNLGENHFWKYAEYIWILNESESVKIAMQDFETLWSHYNDSGIDLSDKKRKFKNIIRNSRRKF
jgi:phosphatidylserine/phosphatidylglycerophosphate/cardiolipin synthase-like enzyme